MFDVLTELANVLEVFFKGLSECCLLTTYSIQLQAANLDFSERGKFWCITIQFVKSLQGILLKIAEDESSIRHDVATQTSEDDHDKENSVEHCSTEVSDHVSHACLTPGEEDLETYQIPEKVSDTSTSDNSTSIKPPETIIDYPITNPSENTSEQNNDIKIELIETTTDINIELIRNSDSSSCPKEVTNSISTKELVTDNNNKENTKSSLVVQTGIPHNVKLTNGNFICVSLRQNNVEEVNKNDIYNYKEHIENGSEHRSSSLLHSCSVCEKTFSTHSQLELHSGIHVQKRECDLCRLKFSSLSTLQEHCRVVHADTGCFYCSVCDRRFRTKLSYKRHIDTHSGKKGAMCDICGKSFRRTDYLQKHHMTHTGQRPFQCSHCQKKFISSSQLKIHLKIHSGVKEYVCNICKKEFSRSDKLKEHTLRHFNIKRYQCTKCLKDYAEKRDLKKHLKVHSI